MTDYVLTPPFKTLVERVQAYLTTNGVQATVARGWKARTRQDNQGQGGANRIVFMGSKPSGDAGRIVGPRQVGPRTLPDDSPTPDAEMRALADWSRSVFVSIWAFDGDNASDEGAQDDAVYQLFVWTMRAVNAVAFGNAVWGAVSFTKPFDREFGLELLAELSFQHQMPDVPDDLFTPQGEVDRPA